MNTAINPTASVISLPVPRFGPARSSFGTRATEFLLRWREAQRVTRLSGRRPLYARGGLARGGGRN